MELDLTGQVALVTGAAGQLGRVIARTLAESGADVAVHYHRGADRAQRVVVEIHALGRRAAMVSGDVTSAADIDAIKQAVTGELGSPSIIVLNAISSYPWMPVLELPLEGYENQFRSCAGQAVLLAQAFVPEMIARGQGRFIAINTECTQVCLPTQSAYVAGKRGMDGVLRVLAREIGASGVTVNQIAPGWMISDRDRQEGTQSQPEYEKNVALKRRGEDRDIANAVVFFASSAARFITGAFLPVNGGLTTVGI